MDNQYTPEQELATLETLSTVLSEQPSQAVIEARINDPMQAVEKTLVDMVADTFASLKGDLDFNKAMQQDILKRMAAGELNANQVIMLVINSGTVANDKISKMFGPMMSLAMSAKQQASLEGMIGGAAGGPIDINQIKRLNDTAPKDVQQGMTTLTMLLQQVLKPGTTMQQTESPEFTVMPDEPLMTDAIMNTIPIVVV